MIFKKIVVLAVLGAGSLCVSAQQKVNDYSSAWKMIDSLIGKKGLTQSAQAEVDKLYARAKKEHNDPQVIKALLYRMNLQQIREEDAAVKNTTMLEKEVDSAREPARSILTSILAETYWDYFQRNRYKFYNRSATAENKEARYKKGDLTTWDRTQFHKRIGELYLASLKDERLLQQTDLSPFDAIIDKGNVRHLRPTLFDLLAHRALNYFKNDERDVDRPAYAFEIEDTVAFSARETFAAHLFSTSDSSSPHFKALELFQHLIRLHLKDSNPSAMLDADIERIRFINLYAVIEEKEELYRRALEQITNRYPNEPAAAEAWFLQAELLTSKAGKYEPNTDTSYRYAYLPAEMICRNVLEQKDSSEGRSDCHELLESILKKELSLQTEAVNLPGLPFRTLVTWRNFPQLFLWVIRIDNETKEKLGSDSYSDDYWKKLSMLKPLRGFSQDLPETGDHQQHRTEIKIDALPVGRYAIVASADKGFISKDKLTDANSSALAVAFFDVSGIAYFHQGSDFFVLDRGSGQPIVKATVQIWKGNSGSRADKIPLIKSSAYRTDEHGHFFLNERNMDDGSNRFVEITAPSDHLFLDGEISKPDIDRYRKAQVRTTFLFTDRSIYRPGQTVYFKGIVVTNDTSTFTSRIIIDLPVKIWLSNANGEKIDSLLLKTNEFGSCQGRFHLPENQLNGRLHLLVDSSNGSASFSMEEYKRPKFFVEYDKLKGSYRVNDTLHIEGHARAYAGNNVDGASVAYRVVREAQVPDYWSYMSGRSRPSASQEIVHGTIKTRPDGSFTISFSALPDKKINKTLEPVFIYKVTADITDVSGETRSGETTVTVGYNALILSVSLDNGEARRNTLPADSLGKMAILTTNSSGAFEAAPIHVTAVRLQVPDRLIRERFWDQPDQFVMSREEYIRNFPHDEYSDETQKEKWKRLEKVYEITDSSREDGNFRLSRKGFITKPERFGAGWYVFEISTRDKYGQEMKNLQYVELYQGGRYSPASPTYDWFSNETKIAQPGDQIHSQVGSSATDVFVIREVENGSTDPLAVGVALTKDSDKRHGEHSFLNLSKENNDFESTIRETDRGGFGIRHAFVKDGRFYSGLCTVQVAWTNKDLAIDYASYRDKTLPGSGEKWKLTIRGNKGQRVASEALTAMYDASLDQFKQQEWEKPRVWHIYQSGDSWEKDGGFGKSESLQKILRGTVADRFVKRYDALMQFRNYYRMGVFSGNARIVLRGMPSPAPMSAGYYKDFDFNYTSAGDMSIHGEKIKKVLFNEPIAQSGRNEPSNADVASEAPVQVRKNFNETAFFFPDLRTDSAGNISFSFTMPEALTSWKWMSLAHTKDLAFGYSEKTVITQKQLMVQPNAPRFLREGDRLELSTKIVNLSDSELTGQVTLELIDATTNQSVDGWFINRQANQFFTVAAGQSAAVHFPIEIPYQFNRPVTYRIVARAKSFSDGEEDLLPVISNRVLVTESLPLNLRGNGTREFHFEKLLQSGSSETLNHHALTVEFSSNPAWYAVQALPYLVEYPYECAEQTFERYYANALAASIVKTTPRIREIFSAWKTTDTAALLSNLEKNPELKSVLLEETPWVLEARSESQQKKNIALLFDATRMTRDLGAALNKLQGMQSPDGGFVWFKGGPDDRYITQTILAGIGHLKKLRAIPSDDAGELDAIVKAGLAYLDKKLIADYEQAKKESAKRESAKREASKTGNTAKRPGTPAARPITGDLSPLQIQYLYLRSLFNDYDIPGPVFPAMNFYRKQAQQYWLQQNRYLQGMIALALFRTGDIRTAQDIMKSLKQNALTSEELGMYWKDMQGGYYWHEAPIETQSLLIEAFREITRDTAVDQGLKIWLLKRKQTQSWSTTKATADACYALLLGGGDWLTADRRVEIRLGDKIVESAPVTGRQTASDKTPAGAGSPAEAGTGYLKTVFPGNIVKPAMGNIVVTLSSARPVSGGGSAGESTGGIAWGAVYWQYFENADKVSASGEPIPGSSPSKETNQATIPLKLTKKLFVTRNTDRGPVLDPIEENAELRVGDKVTVRIELKADRDMEYVHMKDMRASCMEPVNVLSEYKWQDGLGYYETTKDASTNFFFDRVPRGVYVFEYSLFVSQAGNFSNGITTIQCMYAPEFGSHSEGTRVSVVGAP